MRARPCAGKKERGERVIPPRASRVTAAAGEEVGLDRAACASLSCCSGVNGETSWISTSSPAAVDTSMPGRR
jgi:hypothetical protein